MSCSCILQTIQLTSTTKILIDMTAMIVEVNGENILDLYASFEKILLSGSLTRLICGIFFRSLKFLNEWLQSMDYDVNFLWQSITVSTCISKVICIFKVVFKVIGETENPFFCFVCRMCL